MGNAINTKHRVLKSEAARENMLRGSLSTSGGSLKGVSVTQPVTEGRGESGVRVWLGVRVGVRVRLRVDSWWNPCSVQGSEAKPLSRG